MKSGFGKNKMTFAEQSFSDDRMRAEIAKMLVETKQVTVMTFIAPFATAAAVMAATAAVIKLFVV